jgi:hypothetical protein
MTKSRRAIENAVQTSRESEEAKRSTKRKRVTERDVEGIRALQAVPAQVRPVLPAQVPAAALVLVPALVAIATERLNQT